MIGFAVVGPSFDTSQQEKRTFQTLCMYSMPPAMATVTNIITTALILMVSRLTLAVQYLSVLWHVRKFRKTKLPLAIIAGTHIIAADIYLGLTFGFRDFNTGVYIGWYVVGITELTLNVGLGLSWDVISFHGTHLIHRMTLLTLIIIGEGVIVVCNNVSTLVTNSDAWSK